MNWDLSGVPETKTAEAQETEWELEPEAFVPTRSVPEVPLQPQTRRKCACGASQIHSGAGTSEL